MEEENKKTIAPCDTAATASEQSSLTDENSISENTGENKNSQGLQTVSMTELFAQTFSLRNPVIDGLLYPGTYIFAGSPKTGKSNFMLFLAWHVATGVDLWDFHVNKGTVLYLALEDDYRRIQNRLYSMPAVECTENLHFTTQAPKLDEDLMKSLWAFYNEHPDTKLIIIDTLQCVRACITDKYSYARDYETIRSFKRFTDSNGVCILIVHHTRKQQADDSFDMISGTTGIAGAADGAFILRKKERIAKEAYLEVSGRDQPDQVLTLSRDLGTLSWSLIKADSAEYITPSDPILDKVAAFTHDHYMWQGSASELSELAGIKIRPNKLTQRLNAKTDILADEYGVKYTSNRTRDSRLIHLESLQLCDDGDDGDACDDG